MMYIYYEFPIDGNRKISAFRFRQKCYLLIIIITLLLFFTSLLTSFHVVYYDYYVYPSHAIIIYKF